MSSALTNIYIFYQLIININEHKISINNTILISKKSRQIEYFCLCKKIIF